MVHKPIELHILGMSHMIRKHILSCMTTYNFTGVRYRPDAQQLLCTKCLKNLPLLFQYTAYGGRRRLPIAVRLTGKVQVSRMRMQITQSWDCAHVVITCAISRLEHNLGIPRVGNAVSRLRKFPDCVAHNHNHRDNKSWYLSLKNSSHYKTRGWEKYRRHNVLKWSTV